MANSLKSIAKDLRPKMLDLAELPDHGWRAATLSERHDARVSRIVQKLTHPDHDPIVLKYEAKPDRRDLFTGRVAEQQSAFDAFPHSDTLRIPKILSLHPEHQAVMMTFIDARPLTEAFDASGADVQKHAALFEQIAPWVDAFHTARRGPDRSFQIHYTMKTLDRLTQAVAAEKNSVAEHTMFLAAASVLRARAPQYDGQTTIPSLQHNDLHLRNILIGDGVTAGVDFSGGHSAPVGHDIARLLVDYAALHAPIAEIPQDQVVPKQILDGFFKGYTLVSADDPAVCLMLQMRVLTDWHGLPAKAENRTPAQERRLTGILRVAKNAFRL